VAWDAVQAQAAAWQKADAGHESMPDDGLVAEAA
jgi:hypothetical protein